jgi:Zn-finger protein
MKRNITISENRDINIFYNIDYIESMCTFCIDPVYPTESLLKDDVDQIYSTVKDIVECNIGMVDYAKFKASFVTRNSTFWNPEWDKI